MLKPPISMMRSDKEFFPAVVPLPAPDLSAAWGGDWLSPARSFFSSKTGTMDPFMVFKQRPYFFDWD